MDKKSKIESNSIVNSLSDSNSNSPSLCFCSQIKQYLNAQLMPLLIVVNVEVVNMFTGRSFCMQKFCEFEN